MIYQLFSKTISINTLAQLAGRFVIIIFSVITTAFLRRYLGLEEYGVYTYLINFALLFVALADLGTYLITVRESQHPKSATATLLMTGLRLRAVLAFLAMLLALTISGFVSLPAQLEPLRWGMIVLIGLLVWKETLALMLHCYEYLTWSSGLQVLTALTQFLPIIVVAFWGLGLSSFVLWFLLGLVGVVIGVTWLARSLVHWRWQRSWRGEWGLFKKALPWGGILLLSTVYAKIDSFLIFHFLGESALGSYGLAYKVYDNLVLPAAFFLNALLPTLTRLSHNGGGALRMLWWRGAGMLTLVSVGMMLALWFGAKFIVLVLSGESSVLEVHLLQYLGLTLGFAYLNHLTGYTLIVFKKHWQALVIACFALGCNVSLNWWLLPLGGVMVAAYTTIVTEALVLLASFWVIKRCLYPRA